MISITSTTLNITNISFLSFPRLLSLTVFAIFTMSTSRAWNHTLWHNTHKATATKISVMSNNHLSNGESEPLLRRPLLSSQRSIINSTSQVAIVGANVCPIESLDYELVFCFFSSGSSSFVQSLNLFYDPVLIWYSFYYGFAGFLKMNSSSRIGEVEGLFRFCSIYVWSGYYVLWLV